MKLSIKILIQIVVLFSIGVSITIMFILNYFNLNQLQGKNIKIYNEDVMKIKKESIKGNIDLAKEIIKSYYDKKKIYEKEFLLEKKEFLLRQLNSLYDYYKDKLSIEELEELIKIFVKSSRYGESGYFWINDFNYKMIAHPIKPHLEEKVFINDPKVPLGLIINALKKSNKNIVSILLNQKNIFTKDRLYLFLNHLIG